MPLRISLGRAIIDARFIGGGLPPFTTFDDLLLRSTALFMFGLPFLAFVEEQDYS